MPNFGHLFPDLRAAPVSHFFLHAQHFPTTGVDVNKRNDLAGEWRRTKIFIAARQRRHDLNIAQLTILHCTQHLEFDGADRHVDLSNAASKKFRLHTIEERQPGRNLQRIQQSTFEVSCGMVF